MSYTHKREKEKFFISLCEEYHEKILKYLYYATGNIEDAKDLTQEVFMLVYDRLEEISCHENPAGFIYQTAKFKAANFNRKQSIKISHEYNAIEEGVEESEQSAYEQMIREKDERIEEGSYIENILEILDERQRKLYYYRYVEKKNYKEIKILMGVDEVTLRMRCLRLRKQLKKKKQDVEVQFFE